jgi:hypothetical protein
MPLGSLSAEGNGVSGVLYEVTRNAFCGDHIRRSLRDLVSAAKFVEFLRIFVEEFLTNCYLSSFSYGRKSISTGTFHIPCP